MRGGLTSASCQPSLSLNNADDHQLSQISMITNLLFSSTATVDINESALRIHIAFSYACFGRFHRATGTLQFVY